MQKPFFIVTGRLKLQAAALQKIHLFPEGADFFADFTADREDLIAVNRL
jgi:hypothetical protein